jgi:hypothetical protein
MSATAAASARLANMPVWSLAILAVFLAGIGIWMRPQDWVYWLLGATVGGLSLLGLPDHLDSIRLMVSALTGVATLGAVLAFLPRMLRYVVVSVLILFHFVGIATAITCVPPSPWLSMVLWSYVYRPYLEFIYMQNAYHFYSPEPGPACMMWFYVKYEDGTSQWVKIPRREDYPLALEYQRRLSQTESINQLLPTIAVGPDKRNARLIAGNDNGIAVHPGLSDVFQYRVPTAYSKRMLETYTRFVCCHTPHPTNKETKVVSVKVYRVLHVIVTPNDVRNGMDAQDPTNYLPFYQGEYRPDGTLKNPDDPFLYWLIPILKTSQLRAGAGRATSGQSSSNEVIDYCAIHAELGSWSD